MRAALCFALVGVCFVARAADPLSLSIRPQLPPQVRTVAEAAAYYLEPAGYTFHARTPVSGDAGRIVHQPVRAIPVDAGVVSIQTALLSVVPADVYVIVDHEHKAVAFGCARCPGGQPTNGIPASRVDVASLFEVTTQAVRAPEQVAVAELEVESEKAVAAAPESHSKRESSESATLLAPGASPSPQAASRARAVTAAATVAPPSATEVAVTQVGPASIAAIGVAAVFGSAEPVKPAVPIYTYELIAGETLEQGLTRWAKREGFLVLYRPEFQLPVIQNTTVPASSLSEAVTYVLALLADTPHALVADEAPNHVLVIRTP